MEETMKQTCQRDGASLAFICFYFYDATVGNVHLPCKSHFFNNIYISNFFNDIDIYIYMI